jgi:hypothetical protein
MRKKLTKEQFIEKSKEKHPNDDYDYSKFVYNGAFKRGVVICNKLDHYGIKHGEFLQSPSNHLNRTRPRGCPLCVNFKKSHYLYLFKLLEDIPESYYWIGFLMADGHIHHKIKRLTLSVAEKDKEHINKFSKFVNKNVTITKNKKDYKIFTNYRVRMADVSVVSEIIKKFDFKERKTYNPPLDLCISNDNLFISFLIGFIDGDGCLSNNSNNRCCIQIHNHSSWENIINDWVDRLYNLLKQKRQNNKNNKVKNRYCNITIGNYTILRFLKNKTEELKLPILSRKWDRII